MIRWYQFFPNLSSNEVPLIVNYQFSKSTYNQGRRILFVLNQYPNDHGYINLSQRI